MPDQPGVTALAGVRPDKEGGTSFTAQTSRIGMGGLFGGQLMSQATQAALRTVTSGWGPQALHAFFFAPGEEGAPVQLEVTPLRDGRSSCHRRVRLRQGELAVAEVTVVCGPPDTAATPAGGTTPGSTAAPKEVSGPSDGDEQSIFHTRWNFAGLDIRLPERAEDRTSRYHPVWVRAGRPAPEGPEGPASGDPGPQWPLVAFVSDLGLVLAALEPGERRIRRAVTTDHALWFHRPPRHGQWHLLDVRLEERAGRRAVVAARIYDKDGPLVASAVQGAAIIDIRR
jgi:acyl-CoA thioesterase-2